MLWRIDNKRRYAQRLCVTAQFPFYFHFVGPQHEAIGLFLELMLGPKGNKKGIPWLPLDLSVSDHLWSACRLTQWLTRPEVKAKELFCPYNLFIHWAPYFLVFIYSRPSDKWKDEDRTVQKMKSLSFPSCLRALREWTRSGKTVIFWSFLSLTGPSHNY